MGVDRRVQARAAQNAKLLTVQRHLRDRRLCKQSPIYEASELLTKICKDWPGSPYPLKIGLLRGPSYCCKDRLLVGRSSYSYSSIEFPARGYGYR